LTLKPILCCSAAIHKSLIFLRPKLTQGTRFEENQGLNDGFCSAHAFSRRSLTKPRAKDHQSETVRRQYFVLTSYLAAPSNT
jgi:hypothetical protein